MDWLDLLAVQGSLKGFSIVFSNTTVQKHQFYGAQLCLWSNSHIHTSVQFSSVAQLCPTLCDPMNRSTSLVFPVVAYGCESWTVKKAEHHRIDAFELWCWRRLLRVPWTARRPNQSILREISPGISLEGMMLKLKLQYFGHLMWRVDSLEKTE